MFRFHLEGFIVAMFLMGVALLFTASEGMYLPDDTASGDGVLVLSQPQLSYVAIPFWIASGFVLAMATICYDRYVKQEGQG